MESGLLKDFGLRLRALREKRGLTQVELARMIGVHKVQLLRYEHGAASPTAERIVGMARALRVTADALLRGDRKGEETLPFGNVRLYERFRELDRLPKQDQETVLHLVDAVLAKHQLEHLADRVRKSA
jgi:transcriptional regulator with XRE-family HTH domain